MDLSKLKKKLKKKLNKTRLSAIFLIVSQIILIICIIIGLTKGAVGAIIIAGVLGMMDVIVLIFFLAINWDETWEDIDWTNPFDN